MPRAWQFSAHLASGRSGVANVLPPPSGKRARPVCQRGRGWRRNVGGWRPQAGPAGTRSPNARTPALGTQAPTTMLPLLLLLLATARGLDAIPTVGKPSLANTFLGGRTTASTFVLEQPRCIFTNLRDDTIIWLVVALPEAVPNFDNKVEPGGSGREFQKFPNTTLAYMTLNTTIFNYPCVNNSRDITVLRVGSETSCAKDASRPTCNGPLPSPGPYQVKFLALDGSEPVAQTGWSDPISLRKGTSASMLFLLLERFTPALNLEEGVPSPELAQSYLAKRDAALSPSAPPTPGSAPPTPASAPPTPVQAPPTPAQTPPLGRQPI
ncbi:PREDICTED: uroplakin-3b-like protein [Calidris pugnax]|uniref:uroplakin-3b-like protein n=1 Tax=Calidris pugnax TaxID=198806 RepID=UPI00071C5BCD|nr:PREDICTED: uroplakin-3b-like protein [Calidris pugnax]